MRVPAGTYLGQPIQIHSKTTLLLEEGAMRDGRMANAQLTNYLIPTTADTPPIEVVMLESPYRHGPFGAKGIGELPMDGPAPAIVNALRSTGLDIRAIPATPERVFEAVERAGDRVRWAG